jgi:four helix bundle protein
MSRQLLKSATSIGANIEESIGGYSRNEFKQKLSIAYKEARESSYWLRLLKESNYLEAKRGDELQDLCEEIIKILYSIIKTLNQKSY